MASRTFGPFFALISAFAAATPVATIPPYFLELVAPEAWRPQKFSIQGGPVLWGDPLGPNQSEVFGRTSFMQAVVLEPRATVSIAIARAGVSPLFPSANAFVGERRVRERIAEIATALGVAKTEQLVQTSLLDILSRHDPRALPLRNFRLKLLADNRESLQENVALLDAAHSRATISVMYWNNDESGRGVAYAAIKAARRGVSVTVLVDAFSPPGTDTSLLSIMARAGVSVYRFRPFLHSVHNALKRMHEKAIWVDTKDGRVLVLLGGRNKADSYFSGDGVFDVDVRLELDAETGEKLYRRQFEGFLRSKETIQLRVPKSRALTAAQEATLAKAYEAVGRKTLFEGMRIDRGALVSNRGQRVGATSTMEAAIEAAKERVIIANAYFIPGARLENLVLRKLQEGVPVTVFTNSRGSTPHSYVVRLMEGVAPKLIEAGLRLYQRLTGELHAKAAIVDGRYVFVGSVNLDERSELLDSQNGVIVDSPELAAKLRAALCVQMMRGRFQAFKIPGYFPPFDRGIRFLLERLCWFL